MGWKQGPSALAALAVALPLAACSALPESGDAQAWRLAVGDATLSPPVLVPAPVPHAGRAEEAPAGAVDRVLEGLARVTSASAVERDAAVASVRAARRALERVEASAPFAGTEWLPYTLRTTLVVAPGWYTRLYPHELVTTLTLGEGEETRVVACWPAEAVDAAARLRAHLLELARRLEEGPVVEAPLVRELLRRIGDDGRLLEEALSPADLLVAHPSARSVQLTFRPGPSSVTYSGLELLPRRVPLVVSVLVRKERARAFGAGSLAETLEWRGEPLLHGEPELAALARDGDALQALRGRTVHEVLAHARQRLPGGAARAEAMALAVSTGRAVAPRTVWLGFERAYQRLVEASTGELYVSERERVVPLSRLAVEVTAPPWPTEAAGEFGLLEATGGASTDGDGAGWVRYVLRNPAPELFTTTLRVLGAAKAPPRVTVRRLGIVEGSIELPLGALPQAAGRTHRLVLEATRYRRASGGGWEVDQVAVRPITIPPLDAPAQAPPRSGAGAAGGAPAPRNVVERSGQPEAAGRGGARPAGDGHQAGSQPSGGQAGAADTDDAGLPLPE